MINQSKFEETLLNLTPTQLKTLKMFLKGKSDSEIAKESVCSTSNYREHLRNIKNKFQINTPPNCEFREELIMLFVRCKPEWVAQEVKQRVAICPQTNLEYEYPEGQVPLQSSFYIERDNVEALSYQEIVKPGALILIKAPKLMGKTSLISRIFEKTTNEIEGSAVYINFSEATPEVLANLKNFVRWFCLRVGDQLSLQERVEEFWSSSLGATSNTLDYFEKYILKLDSPIILGLDEIERIFPHSRIAPSFLGLLRLFHEKPKISSLKRWENLRLIVAHSTEVYVKLKATQSPFNVGTPISLCDFSAEQIRKLANLHGLDWSDLETKKLMAMVNGHPFLIRLAMYHLGRQTIGLEELLLKATSNEGIYNDHLRGLLTKLQEDESLTEAYKKVVHVASGIELSPLLAYQLTSMGLVKKQENKVLPRCGLYHKYFQHVL